MDQRLSLKIGQKLVLTPTLQQAIKLLQLSKLELIQHINQELQENPVLEEVSLENPLAGTGEAAESSPEKDPELQTMKTELPEDSPYNVELDWTYYDQPDIRASSVSGTDESGGLWYENVLKTRQSLQDYLMWQLHLTLDNEEELAVGEEIIGNIDDEGYLRADEEEIASLLSIDPEKVKAVLEIVQTFDPPGAGARSIEECLKIQLMRFPERHPLAEEIVSSHLKELENKNYHQISHNLKKPIEDIFEAAGVISGLEPKPGRLFSTDEPHYIIPDLYIYKIGQDYQISLNDEGMPKLRINRYYRKLMSDQSLPANAREYIHKKYSSALWLVKSIHQRQKTIYRVAESIVHFQKDFLEHGIDSLKPMILRDVADHIGVHESTVSRVTTRKYAQTPQGLFELKFFFNTGIGKDAGPSVASASVQNMIRKIVEEEDPVHTMSDQMIASILRKQHGLIIARRTVAKYRKILKILPANKRRRVGQCKNYSNDKEGGTIRCT